MKTREKGSVDWQMSESTKHDELVTTDGNLPETLLSRTPSLSYPCPLYSAGPEAGADAAQGTDDQALAKLRLDNSQKQAKGEKKPPREGEIEKTQKENGFPKRKSTSA